MTTNTILLRLLIIIITIVLLSCEYSTENQILDPESESNNYSLQKQMEGKKFNYDKLDYYRTTYDMQDVELLAYSIAKVLKDEKVRKVFKKLHDNSKNSEKIIEASSLLNFTYFDDDSKVEKSFKKLIEQNTKEVNKENIKNKFGNLDFGLFDIYFPIKKHREKWDENQELIVAALNSKISEGENKIVAFNFDGMQIDLDSQTEPEIPTLVVVPSEKYGEYELRAPSDEPPTQWYYLYKTRLREIYVRDDYEGWGMGANEIMVKYRIYYESTGNYSGWSRIGTYEMDPGDVVSLNTVYISKTFNTYQFELKVEEDDDWFLGGDDDLVADNYWNFLYDINLYVQNEVLVDQNVTKIDLFYPKRQAVRDVDGNGNKVELEFNMEAVLTSN
jgi:hypothetical protein